MLRPRARRCVRSARLCRRVRRGSTRSSRIARLCTSTCSTVSRARSRARRGQAVHVTVYLDERPVGTTDVPCLDSDQRPPPFYRVDGGPVVPGMHELRVDAQTARGLVQGSTLMSLPAFDLPRWPAGGPRRRDRGRPRHRTTSRSVRRRSIRRRGSESRAVQAARTGATFGRAREPPPAPCAADDDHRDADEQDARDDHVDEPSVRGRRVRHEREEDEPDALDARRDGRRADEEQRAERDQRVDLLLPLAEDDGRPDAQRRAREQLVGDAEHRPDGRDVPGEDEVAPARRR